jgi:hypothetical protein
LRSESIISIEDFSRKDAKNLILTVLAPLRLYGI